MLYLVDRCDVQRRGRTDQAYGGKAKYSPHLGSLPCRLVVKTQRGFNSLTAEWVVATTYSLVTAPDADVTEGDRITNLRTQDGELVQQNFEVDGGAVKHRGRMAQHKTLRLRRMT